MKLLKSSFTALVLYALVLGCSNVHYQEIRYKAPVVVGTYSILFDANISELGRVRISKAIANSQRTFPMTAVPLTLFVYNDYVASGNLSEAIMAAVLYNTNSKEIKMVATPAFYVSNEFKRNHIVAHEMVHAYLYTKGLGITGDDCDIFMQERIAYGATLKITPKRSKLWMETLYYMAEYDAKIKENSCDEERFNQFHEEFKGYEQQVATN